MVAILITIHLTKSVCPDGLPMQCGGKDEVVLLMGALHQRLSTGALPIRHPSGMGQDTLELKKLNLCLDTETCSPCRPNSGSKPDGDRCQKFASLNQPFNFNAGGFGQPFAGYRLRVKTYASVASINLLEREKLPTSYLPLYLLSIPQISLILARTMTKEIC